MHVKPAILGGLVAAPCHVRHGLTLPPQFGFAQPSDQRAQICVVQKGNIVPGDFKHDSKLGKLRSRVNHR
jgi:hypothetical protein